LRRQTRNRHPTGGSISVDGPIDNSPNTGLAVHSDPILTPEERYLREQDERLSELTQRLAEKEAEFATTRSRLAAFRTEYVKRFGPLYAELDRLEASIARASGSSHETKTRAAEADRRAAAAEAAAREAEEDATSHAEPSKRARELYLAAAMRVHPDLALDEPERARRTRIMAALNEAYEAGDEAALLRILEGESARPEDVQGDDVASRLVRTIRKLAQVQGRFTELVQMTEAVAADPLFKLFSMVRAEWEAGHDPLLDDERDLRQRIASARQEDAMIGAVE
jgi:hypothetical protein